MIIMNGAESTSRLFGRRHHDRQDLAGEHPLGDAGQIIAFILFLLVWVLDSFVIRFSTVWAETIPIIVRLGLAFPLFLFSGYLAFSGLNTVFREVRDVPQVIQKGVFSISRHPIYLSALLLYLGFFLTTFSLMSLALLFCIFIFYRHIVMFEERLLEKKFGQDYEEYKRDTPRWLLRF
jgi:protein-S-isoprenylcysteine O-methyltransferase Ste14